MPRVSEIAVRGLFFLGALFLIHPRFGRLVPSRAQRVALAVLLALSPGLGALRGIPAVLAVGSFAAGVGVAPAGGAGASLAAAALAVAGEIAVAGSWPAGISFSERAETVARLVVANPLLGAGRAGRLLGDHRLGFWAIVALVLLVVAISVVSPLPVANRRFPEPPRPLAPFVLAAIAAALVMPPGAAAPGGAAAFLPAAWSLFFWAAFLFRGLKPRAVVIYYAAAAVAGLYLLFLHAVTAAFGG